MYKREIKTLDTKKNSPMKPGLYEQVINRLLDIRLGDKKYKVETEKIEVEESPKILSK